MKDTTIFVYVRATTVPISQLPSQIAVIERMAHRKGIEVVETIYETTPNDPGLFDQTLARVAQGEASGILGINPQHISDLRRIGSLLDAHMGNDTTHTFTPAYVGHYMLSRPSSHPDSGIAPAYNLFPTHRAPSDEDMQESKAT